MAVKPLIFIPTFVSICCLNYVLAASEHARSWSSLDCSLNEMLTLQRRWKQLMTETSVADKTALYEAVIDYVARRNATTAFQLTHNHTSAQEPVQLMAYRLFTDIDLYINSYTSVDTYVSLIEHLALTRTAWTNRIVQNIDLLFEAIVQVVGRLIGLAEEKVTWSSCMEHMAHVTKLIVSSVKLRATCDVTTTSGDPDVPILGTISFTQPAVGGPTIVKADLTGFPEDGKKHGIHIHEGGTTADRCMAAGPHFNPHSKTHGGPDDVERHVGDLGNLNVGIGGRVLYSLTDEHLSLLDKHSIVGRTIVIHALEDDLGRGNFPDSKTTGHAGGRIACCVINRVYV